MYTEPYSFDNRGDVKGIYFVRQIAAGARTTLPDPYRCATFACDSLDN